MSQRSHRDLLHRLRVFPIALAFLLLLGSACGGSSQEIRQMAAEKLEGVAEQLADGGTGTPTPTTGIISDDISSVTITPTVLSTKNLASVATATQLHHQHL